ncbi:MAG TPA: response regulator transcription factor [Flavisolibacter sp.]|nr:response regulator transcription factor [Flavisolibacter sp.]
MATKILVFDDNRGRQEALQLLIESSDDLQFVGARENCNQVEADVLALKPDVVLMDIDMPGTNGIEGLKRIRKQAPHVFIIMQTVFEDDEKIFTAIHAGAHGYFLKNTKPEKLLEGIHDVLDGGAPMTSSVARKVLNMFAHQSSDRKKNPFDLTEREIDILSMLGKGLSYKMIADAGGISFHTVNSHLKKIYEKLHVHSATEAVSKAFSPGNHFKGQTDSGQRFNEK